MQGDIGELHRLLEGYDTAILTTRGPDGHYHSRPMAVQQVEGDADLWFATSMDTQKIADLEADPHCGLAFHDRPKDATYVSISGDVEVVRDRQTIHEKWSASWRAWFPQGPDQEDLVLLKVRPSHAEYVHPETGRLKVLATRVKAVFTKERVGVADKKELDLPH